MIAENFEKIIMKKLIYLLVILFGIEGAYAQIKAPEEKKWIWLESLVICRDLYSSIPPRQTV